MRRLRALCLVLALCLPIPGRAAAEGPVFLLVPLLSPPGEEEWLSRTLDRILEEEFKALDGVVVAGGDDRKAALLRLTKEPKIGPGELVKAMERGAATHAVVGQFSVEDDVVSLDLRLFAAEEKKQTAVFREDAFYDEAFSLLADAAKALAVEAGAVIAENTAGAPAKPPTDSLRAYRLYTDARAETDMEKRIALLEEAVETDPSYFDAHQALGLEFYQLGRAEEALPWLQNAARLGREMAEAQNNLAVLYAQLGRMEEALDQFEKALALRPDYPEARLNYGRLLEEHGRFDEAEGVYSDLLDADPDNVKARSSLALLYERTGRTELAIQEYRILSRKTPELAENYFLRSGRQARKAKEYRKAEKYFLRAVDVNPQLAQGYAELGINAYFAERHDQSVKYFRQALALEPQRGEYHHFLGLAHEKIGERQEARKSFRRSIELGGPLESRVSLASIYLADGETSRAIDELNLVLDEDPAQEEAKEMLSRALNRAEAQQKKEQQRAEFATHRLERLEVIIEQLNRTNRELENRVFALQSGRQEVERELEQLRSEQAEREALVGGRMEDAIRSIEQLSGNEDLERLRQEYLGQVRELEEKLTEKERSLQETARDLEEARELMIPADEDAPRALLKERKKSASLEEELEAARGELEVAGRQEKQLKKDLGELEKRDAERGKSNEGLQKKVDRLQSQKLEDGKEISALNERNRGLARKVTDVEKELDSSRRALEKVRGESESLREESGRSGRETAELRERAAALGATREALEKEVKDLRRGYGDLTVRVTELERDLAEERKAADEARAGAGDLRERLLGEVGEKEREAADLREREALASAEGDRLRQSVADLEGRLGEAQKKIESAGVRREEAVQALRVEYEDRLAEAQGNAAAAESGKEDALLRLRDEYEALLASEREQHGTIYRAEEAAREAYERVRRELAGQALELGTIHMRNRAWEKAGLYLQRVVEIDPRNAKAYYSLGEIYFQLGRFELSKEMYQKAQGVY